MKGLDQRPSTAAAAAVAAAHGGGSVMELKRRPPQPREQPEQQQQQRQRLTANNNTEGAEPLGASATSASPPLLALLSDDLLWRVLALAGAWGPGRALCRQTLALADGRIETLVVNPRAPAPVLHTLLPRLRAGRLRALDLTGAAAVDDSFLRWLLHEALPAPQLQHLGLSYCAQLTPASTPLLSQLPSVALRGCWRLLRPCPSLPSEAVLELQLLALQQNDAARHDGVAKHYEFASPANRGITEDGAAVGLQAFAAVVYERLSPMLGCQSFSVRQLSYDSPDRACFLVRTQGVGCCGGNNGDVGAAAAAAATTTALGGSGGGGGGGCGATQHYLWLLSRQAAGQLQGCWMTDAIISAEHGLLSFLNLPLLATEEAAGAAVAGAGVGGGGEGGSD